MLAVPWTAQTDALPTGPWKSLRDSHSTHSPNRRSFNGHGHNQPVHQIGVGSVEDADRLAFSDGPRRRYKYEFTVEIDQRPGIAVPKTNPVAVEVLELTRPHWVKIRDAGRVIESFRFTFADRGGFPLCLAYTPGYQTWSLERARPGQEWCECQASSQGPPSHELQRTRPTQTTAPRR
jgi:hypothetical protein